LAVHKLGVLGGGGFTEVVACRLWSSHVCTPVVHASVRTVLS